MVDHAQQLADRIWQRYDRKQRLIRYAVLFATLMMLVSAMMGVQSVKRIYAHAIDEKYRFFSYGDASLLLR